MQGEKKSSKNKQRNKCRKIIIGLNKLKILKGGKKLGKLPETAKVQCRGSSSV